MARADFAYTHQGLYSLSGKTSYQQISSSLEAARLDAITMYRSQIWQASRQRCCRGACQILERMQKPKRKARGFEASRDLALSSPTD